MTAGYGSWPRPAAAMARAVDAALSAARAGDAVAFAAAADDLSRVEPEQLAVLLGTVTRDLLERSHPDGLDTDDVEHLLRSSLKLGAGWYEKLDGDALVLALTGALGVSTDPDPDEPPRPGGAAQPETTYPPERGPPRDSGSGKALPVMEEPRRVDLTPAAADLLARLTVQHGPLMFHQSGGCCDGSSPMCYPDGDLLTGDADVHLGDLAVPGLDRPVPFWMSVSQYAYWKHTHLTVDVVPGRGSGFSVEAPEGVRFLIRSRLMSDDELTHFQLI